MTLFVSCTCGKVLRVPATAAGKQVRCPQCGAVLPVPGDVESKAAEPDAYSFQDGPASSVENPTPPAEKPAPRQPPIRWKSRRGAGRKRAQKQVYLGCGFLSILVGLGFLILTAAQEHWSGKVLVAGIALAVIGVVSIVQALTGTMPDDWKDLDSF